MLLDLSKLFIQSLLPRQSSNNDAPSGAFLLALLQPLAVKPAFYNRPMKTLLLISVSVCLQGCTVLAIADAAGSAVVYGVKTTINVLDAVTPDIINKKKD